MDKATATSTINRLEAALKKLESELGVTFKVGNGRYSSTDVSVKITATEDASDGTKVSPDQVDFVQNCARWGMKPTDIGRKFISQRSRKVFTLTGSSSRRHKYPISAVDQNGRGFKFPPTAVKFI